MNRAVCRNCWTWYSKGETACPNCHIALTSADIGAAAFGSDTAPPAVAPPPALPQPTADAPFPAPVQSESAPLTPLQLWLIGRAALAAVLVISSIVGGLFLTGVFGPVKSSDGAFSVKVPSGWAVAKVSGAKDRQEVLALARLEQTNGVESHFVVTDPGQFFPLADLETAWQPYVESGKFPIAGTVGSIRRTTVAGTSALTADFQGSRIGGQILFLDYGGKTYVIEMSSDPTEFGSLRDSDFAAILSSWQWR